MEARERGPRARPCSRVLELTYGLDAADEFLLRQRSLAGAFDDQHYWDVVTVLDVLWELDPGDLPPTWDLARFEQYLGVVLEHV